MKALKPKDKFRLQELAQKHKDYFVYWLILGGLASFWVLAGYYGIKFLLKFYI